MYADCPVAAKRFLCFVPFSLLLCFRVREVEGPRTYRHANLSNSVLSMLGWLERRAKCRSPLQRDHCLRQQLMGPLLYQGDRSQQSGLRRQAGDEARLTASSFQEEVELEPRARWAKRHPAHPLLHSPDVCGRGLGREVPPGHATEPTSCGKQEQLVRCSLLKKYRSGSLLVGQW